MDLFSQIDASQIFLEDLILQKWAKFAKIHPLKVVHQSYKDFEI